MKKKTLIWAAVLAVIAAASAGVYLFFAPGGTVANVYVDGELYDSFDLAAVALPYEAAVRTAYGYNLLRVSHGAVEVIRADCAEQVCVNQGAIEDGLLPIVCLPHHLVIQIEEGRP